MRFLSLVLFSFSALFVFAQADSEGADIRVTVDGLTNGKAYLIGQFGDQYFRADSSQIVDGGKMHFTTEEPYEPGLYFVFVQNQVTLQVLIDKDQVFEMNTRKADPTGAMVVTGSLDNELLFKNLKFEAELNPKLSVVTNKLSTLTEGIAEYDKLKVQQDELVDQRKRHLASFSEQYPNSFFTIFKMAGQNPELTYPKKADGTLDTAKQVFNYRNAFWDNVDLTDGRLLRTPVVFNKLKKYMKEITPQVPDSIIASADRLIGKVIGENEYYKFFCNWIALNYEPEKTTVMDPQAISVHMVRNFFTKERAFWEDTVQIWRLQQRAEEMEASLIGLKGPNVNAKDPSGVKRSLYDMKADYVVVYMYNPTCEHCMEQTPKLVEYYNQWKEKGESVEVYAIALGTDNEEWTNYIRTVGMKWTNVFDPTNRAIFKKYYVDITPEVYVLDKDKVIIAKNINVDQIQGVIDRDRK